MDENVKTLNKRSRSWVVGLPGMGFHLRWDALALTMLSHLQWDARGLTMLSHLRWDALALTILSHLRGGYQIFIKYARARTWSVELKNRGLG